MKIAKFTTQKKNKDRLNVYVEKDGREEFAFAIDLDVFIKYELTKGMELEDDFVRDVLQAEEEQKAYKAAVNYLSYRMRAVSEVRDYLVKKEIDEAAIKRVIERLIEQRYLNDAEFAKAYTQTKFNTSPSGPIKIKRELTQLRIDADIIEEVIGAISHEDQLEKAGKFVNRKQMETNRRSATEVQQRIQQTLMQRGFTFDIISEAILTFWENEDEDVELSACLTQAEKLNRKFSGYAPYERKQRMKLQLRRKGFPYEVIDRALDRLAEQES
ncbi:recombination regulator RecX [Exiguobacterium aurantiacum]|uniref:recombination regulator RecX n=1 Tax=Exiguobacterium aurantiacum TaxID=33987 RepID=UPI003D02184D